MLTVNFLENNRLDVLIQGLSVPFSTSRKFFIDVPVGLLVAPEFHTARLPITTAAYVYSQKPESHLSRSTCDNFPPKSQIAIFYFET